MQDFRGDVARAELGAEAEEAAEAVVLAAELGQERGRKRDGVALRDHGIVAIARRGQELRLALEKEERREDALSQSLRQGITPLFGQTERRDRQAHAGQKEQRVAARSIAIRADRHASKWSGRCGISPERRGSAPPHALRRSWGRRPGESATRFPVAARGRARE